MVNHTVKNRIYIFKCYNSISRFLFNKESKHLLTPKEGNQNIVQAEYKKLGKIK